jgi:flagellar biosynthesis GTPase FlhF
MLKYSTYPAMFRPHTILLLALCCTLSSCDRKADDDSALKDERREAVLKQHAAYEKELLEATEREQEIKNQQREINRKFKDSQAQNAAEKAAEAKAATKALLKIDAKERRAARKAIIHKKYSSITLRDGSRYLDVEIIKVSDSGITITHLNGARGIDFEQLPYSLQLACKYVPPTAN